MPKAHERRFDGYKFPTIHTEYRPVPQVDFEKMRMRDDVVYRDTKCSDPLFDPKQLNLVRKKGRGILQFGKSVVERDTKVVLEPENKIQPCHCRNADRFSRRDEPDFDVDDLDVPLEDIANPDSDPQLRLKPQLQKEKAAAALSSQKPSKRKHKKSHKKLEPLPKKTYATNNQVTQDYRGNFCMARVDYRTTSLHDRRGLPLEKQLSRDAETGPALPCFLQHQHARLSLDFPTTGTHAANNVAHQPFLDPRSCLNLRSDFRIRKAKSRLDTKSLPDDDDERDDGSARKQQTQSLTFNQLLEKYGYI